MNKLKENIVSQEILFFLFFSRKIIQVEFPIIEKLFGSIFRIGFALKNSTLHFQWFFTEDGVEWKNVKHILNPVLNFKTTIYMQLLNIIRPIRILSKSTQFKHFKKGNNRKLWKNSIFFFDSSFGSVDRIDR